MKAHIWQSSAIVLAISLQACSAGSAATATPGTAFIPTSNASSIASAARANTAYAVSLTALPLDDANYETAGPRVGWIYSCQGSFNGGGSMVDGPWIDTANNTWNLLEKLAVQGAVHWASSFSNTVAGTKRNLRGNGLPSHVTGTYPISSTDPAFAYDRNPNTIRSQSVADAIPSNPAIASKPSCVGLGAIGVMLTGAQLYNALDGAGRDAPAHEVLDTCNGHPDQSGTYHYHMISKCMSDPGTGHSNLLGYAADGFGIYGVRGTNGKTLTDAALDACHGHTHAIVWNGRSVVMYHYHMPYDYPYSVGCYRGTPAISQTGPPGPP